MNKWIPFLTTTICLGMFGILIYTWFQAYQNLGHAVTIYINRQGEMNYELIAFPIIFIECLIIHLYYWINELK